MLSKTTFGDLYADILLIIFEFFTVNEIYSLFDELIPNLTSLLVNSNVRLHLRNSVITEVDPGQIISLDIECLPRSSSPSLSNFVNLHSLVLHDLEDPWVLVHQPLSKLLQRLYLNISLRNKHIIIVELLPVVVCLPKLKSCTIVYPSSHFILQEDSFTLPTSSTTIENLELEVKCSLICLEKLLGYLPRLRHLHATVEFHEENVQIYSRAPLFPTVQYLFLSWHYIPLAYIVRFCQTMPHLKQCILNATDYRDDQDIFYPDLWQQFIEHDHIMLKNLRVNMKRKPSHDVRVNSHWLSLGDDHYFGRINFNFEIDCWGNIVLEGDYTKVNATECQVIEPAISL